MGVNDRLSGVRLGGVVTGAKLMGEPDSTTGDTLPAGAEDGLGDDTTGDALLLTGAEDGDEDGTVLGFNEGLGDAGDKGLALGLCDGVTVGDTLTNPLP